jgi:alditol oxidase
MGGHPVNWAGNVVFSPARLHRPTGIPELQSLVAQAGRARALATGHSFSRIADTPGVLVSTLGLPAVTDIDRRRRTVTVSAGLRYGELSQHLHAAGYALPNLGSLPHISVAGACATGSHGSGDANGNLATAVSALEMVTADGGLTALSREDGEEFLGAVVGLGALGIVTTLVLDLVPDFEVSQWVYEDLPAPEVTHHFDEIFGSAYSVSVFTDWQGTRHSQVWLKHRGSAAGAPATGGRWHGARPARGPRHPVAGMPVEHSTPQAGVPGPWHERLPHFRLGFTPSAGRELQSEYLLPRDAAAPALAAVAGLRGALAPVLQVSEIRTVAADRAWMSPCYLRDTVAIHFTWADDPGRVSPVIAAVEEALAPFGARPHWGKLFSTPPETVRSLYPRWGDFAELARQYDPAGKFRNQFMDRYFPRRGQ